MRVIFFGTGAIGGTAGAWVAAKHAETVLVARGNTYRAIRENGLTLYREGGPRERVRVNVVECLEDAPDADVVVIAVKNFNLEQVCPAIRDRFGIKPVIVGLQNGVRNQRILPRYFPRVLYGIVGYNAWIDTPGVIGFQKKGPILLGTPDNGLRAEARAVAGIFQRGVPAPVIDRLQDAAHCKLVLNLSNSVTTLVGHGYGPVEPLPLFQRILSNVLLEGIQIVRAAGHREFRISGMPNWALIKASAKLPQFATLPLFRRNLRKMVRSSMSQDVIQCGRHESELEDINGYLIGLADSHGIPAPYNRAVYRLCQEHFSRPAFAPVPVRDVWNRIAST